MYLDIKIYLDISILEISNSGRRDTTELCLKTYAFLVDRSNSGRRRKYILIWNCASKPVLSS
jgi:hypothetical protein